MKYIQAHSNIELMQSIRNELTNISQTLYTLSSSFKTNKNELKSYKLLDTEFKR